MPSISAGRYRATAVRAMPAGSKTNSRTYSAYGVSATRSTIAPSST